MAVRRPEDHVAVGSSGAPDEGSGCAPLEHVTYIPLPLEALHEAVSSVDDLLELKIILVVLRALARQRPGQRWVAPRELLRDPSLSRAVASVRSEDRQPLVATALRRACQRGILVCARGGSQGAELRFALNSQADRQALQAAGWAITAEGLTPRPDESTPARSGIFELYEQNVGLVTPLLADELREAEQAYPADWVEDAFREAVGYNKRNWRYIKRILENWATEGRGGRGTTWRRAEAARNRRRNLGGRFGTVPG